MNDDEQLNNSDTHSLMNLIRICYFKDCLEFDQEMIKIRIKFLIEWIIKLDELKELSWDEIMTIIKIMLSYRPELKASSYIALEPHIMKYTHEFD